MAPSSSQEPEGSWDSIHVFESSERGRQAHYKLTSTIMLQLTTHQASEEGSENDKKATGPSAASIGNNKYRDIQPKRKSEITLSGSMTRQVRSLSYLICIPFRIRRLRRARAHEAMFFLVLKYCFLTNVLIVGARLANPWTVVSRHKHRPHDWRYGNKNAQFFTRGIRCHQRTEAVCLTCFHDQVYFGKTRDIVYDLRSVENLERARQQKELQKELVGFIKRW